jgi:hypothetical protein
MRERIGMPIVALILIIFVVVGIDAIIHPTRYMRSSYLRSGGEMLREWNKTGIQFFGLILGGVSG